VGEARLLASSWPSADSNTNMKGLMKVRVFLRNRGTGQYYAGGGIGIRKETGQRITKSRIFATGKQ
jgi:hypothetical protein